MWDKYLYQRLPETDRHLIDKLRSRYQAWKEAQTSETRIIKVQDREHLRNNLDLIEVQLYSLLKQINFNRHLYVKEQSLFDERPPRKHLEVCVKSFNLALFEFLRRHGVELLLKIQPLEKQFVEELNDAEQQQLGKMDVEPWGPFYLVAHDDFGRSGWYWPMTLGGPLKTPARMQLQSWVAPWVAVPSLALPGLYATSGSCAEAAQRSLVDWEENIIIIVLKQLRSEP